MKAVMISIQPKWCELIASGKKTIEVRKTKPKLDVPFKCYIYCTYGNALADLSNCSTDSIEADVRKGTILRYALQEHKIMTSVYSSCGYGNGKVIGEFVCAGMMGVGALFAPHGLRQHCITQDELFNYANGKTLYGWRISNLTIYDKPKELGEFMRPSDCVITRTFNIEDLPINIKNWKALYKPPQSWCYVEEL